MDSAQVSGTWDVSSILTVPTMEISVCPHSVEA